MKNIKTYVTAAGAIGTTLIGGGCGYDSIVAQYDNEPVKIEYSVNPDPESHIGFQTITSLRTGVSHSYFVKTEDPMQKPVVPGYYVASGTVGHYNDNAKTDDVFDPTNLRAVSQAEAERLAKIPRNSITWQEAVDSLKKVQAAEDRAR